MKEKKVRLVEGISSDIMLVSVTTSSSFQVANPLVRANATALLVDAFPLVDPDASRPDREK